MTVGVVMFLAGAAFFAASVFLLYGIKKQLSEMTEALKEVKMGNETEGSLQLPVNGQRLLPMSLMESFVPMKSGFLR